jgi:hypothetical protein
MSNDEMVKEHVHRLVHLAIHSWSRRKRVDAIKSLACMVLLMPVYEEDDPDPGDESDPEIEQKVVRFADVILGKAA